jgi:hypothetical protein
MASGRAGHLVRAIVGIALTAASAPAARPQAFPIKCPVCNHSLWGRQVVWFPDANLGRDRDFLTHAIGPQPFLLACWTCPRCLYTGFPGDFVEDIGRLLASDGSEPQEPPPPTEPAPRSIPHLNGRNPLVPRARIDRTARYADGAPALIRYDLLIQVLRLDPATPPGRLAYAHICAAQTQRFDWHSPFLADRHRCASLLQRVKSLPETLGYERDVATARCLEELAADAGSGLDAHNRAFALAKAAQLYKMRGEDPDAVRVVALARRARSLEPGLEDALKDIEVRVEREREYSLGAVSYLERVLAAGRGFDDVRCIPRSRSDPEAKAFCAYLIGVIQRRAGEQQRALERLEPLLGTKNLPAGLDTWIEDEIRKAKR